MRSTVILFLFTFVSGHILADDFKPEEGFKPLLNGRDLTGWKLKKGGDSLDGKTETATKRFSVKDEILVIDAKVKGDITIETAKEFGKDVVIKFEFLPGAGCNNDLFLRDAKFDVKTDVKGLKKDEWNQMEVTVAGKKVEFKVNGETVKMVNAKADKSPLGVRAEAGPIQIRRMRYKEAE